MCDRAKVRGDRSNHLGNVTVFFIFHDGGRPSCIFKSLII